MSEISQKKLEQNTVRIHLLPGGKMPERKTAGAVAFDVFTRAIVSPHEMDPQKKFLRKTLFDFENISSDDLAIEGHIVTLPQEKGLELAYRLEPHESVLLGIGFITEMAFPMLYKIHQRSGLSSVRDIVVVNNDTIVDSDYRGEAGVRVKNIGDHPFLLKKGMRIAQIKFELAVIPDLTEVLLYDDLSQTERGAKGFGSTGIK